jgi:hypothetical protein
MSLLQDVLRHQTMDSIERRFDITHTDSDNSDDELVNVVRCPGLRVACRRLSLCLDVYTGFPFTIPPSDQARVAVTRIRLEI